MNWWLIGGAAALVLIARQAAAASTACKPCYDAKSASYRACMQVPTTQQAQRNACFNAADIALQDCLSRCGG